MTGPAFTYARPSDVAQALEQGAVAGAAFLAGGTDLLQLWKAGVQAPTQVVDLARLPLAGVRIEGDALVLGATARLADVAGHGEAARGWPLVSQAILASASGQIRNMATIGGNLLQRTRCPYFRSAALPCNKRDPGSGCAAIAGENRMHAILGASDACVAAHPSDLAVALTALDAEVETLSARGVRRLGLAAFYRLPGQTPERETGLEPGEMITAVRVPRFAGAGAYLKVRDRASFEFAVVSVAAAMRLEAGVIAEARLAAGGVGTIPWRLAAAEAALVGRAPGRPAFAAAAEAALAGAQPLTQNGFKVELLRRAVIRALENLRALETLRTLENLGDQP